MNCCNDVKIILENNHYLCYNCGCIKEYLYINNDGYNYDRIMSNLRYRKTCYKRKKYLLNKMSIVRNLNNKIILFLEESLEEIRKFYGLKRSPINKYLNSLYKFYCDRTDFQYVKITNNPLIEFDKNILKILNEKFIKYKSNPITYTTIYLT